MESPISFVRSHLKAFYIFLTVSFLGFIYFVVGVSIWLLVYLFLCLLFIYFVLVYKGGFKRTFLLRVSVLLFPVVLGLAFLYLLVVEEVAYEELSGTDEIVLEEDLAEVEEDMDSGVMEIE